MEENNKLEITGNDFIDAYNLGYEAGKREKQVEVDQAETKRSEYYWKLHDAEKSNKDLNEEIAALRAKNKKLINRNKSLKSRLKKDI